MILLVFVFTPNGDLVQLPVDSTPIDFAFNVHTEVGLHCIGAKVDHKVVPLNTILKNGDTVEILTSKSQNPSYGWLKFIVTSKARNNINKFTTPYHTHTPTQYTDLNGTYLSVSEPDRTVSPWLVGAAVQLPPFHPYLGNNATDCTMLVSSYI